jgi:hypothetical protein
MSAFLENLPVRYLAAGVYPSEVPDPRYTLYEYIPLYLFTQGMGGEGGVGEPVRRLEGR